jgi:enoyl-CoA hydratase
MDHLLVETHAGWARLTLHRPAVKNALNTALLADLATALNRFAADPACHAVLITGADGNFAAGADIAEIELRTSLSATNDPRKLHWADIRAFPKPLVAAIDGFALGGGFELALMADLMVIGDTARLGLPETSLGLVPGAGGGQRLLALVGRMRAARLILTGEVIDAATAWEWGIASHRAAGSALPDAIALTDRISQRAPLALAAAKRALIEGTETALAFAAERDAFETLLDSADKIEGIAAFREKRRPWFTGT